MNAVPKAAILAAWLNQWLAGLAGPDDVIDAAGAGDDDPPRIVWMDAPDAADAPGDDADAEGALGDDALVRLFATLRTAMIDHVRLVLPTPGDVSGLPAGSPGSDLAIQEGQAIVAEQAGDAALLLVPEETSYGSAPRIGVRTVWHLATLPGGRHAPLGAVTVPEAGRALKECVLEVGRRLGDGDHRLAEWRQDNADALRGPDGASGLPALDPKSLQLAEMAGRMLHVVESTRSHDELAPALLTLDQAARRALVAAVSS